jgi:hypothetical protein
LRDVVDAYISDHRRRAKATLTIYAHLPTLKDAVRRAAWAERPDRKREDHQRRLSRSSLGEAERRLDANPIRGVRSFEDLHAFLERTIGDVPGIGELMVYDTALRIGARLGVEPRLVFLHAGTREGARALGLRTINGYLRPGELPAAFRRLSPREMEDCLCIFKADLKRLAQ